MESGDSGWSIPDSDSDNMSWSYQQHNILSELPWTTTYDSPELAPPGPHLADVEDYQPSDAPTSSSAMAAPTMSNASSSSSEDKSTDKAAASTTTVAETSTKVKKKAQKRVRQPRFAFMTKSEVDHLEDGYRWRKYGQKAVKNSPFPRSYYRCTSAACNVKKRVERLLSDPSVVVTTYEGQHTHPCTILPRGMTMPLSGGPTAATAYMLQMTNNNSTTTSLLQHHLQINNMNVNMVPPQLNQYGNMRSPNSSCPMLSAQPRRNATTAAFTTHNNGLLEDILPSFFNNHHDY